MVNVCGAVSALPGGAPPSYNSLFGPPAMGFPPQAHHHSLVSGIGFGMVQPSKTQMGSVDNTSLSEYSVNALLFELSLSSESEYLTSGVKRYC